MVPFAVTPDPNTVVAGWIPLVLVLILGLAMVFLYRSLRNQMRKINIPAEGVPTRPQEAERTASTDDKAAREDRTGETTKG